MQASIKHGRTRDEARACLAQAVAQAQRQFGPLLHRAEWSGDTVRLSGAGFEIDGAVDDREIHLSGRLALFGALLGTPLLLGLKEAALRALGEKKPPPEDAR